MVMSTDWMDESAIVKLRVWQRERDVTMLLEHGGRTYQAKLVKLLLQSSDFLTVGGSDDHVFLTLHEMADAGLAEHHPQVVGRGRCLLCTNKGEESTRTNCISWNHL